MLVKIKQIFAEKTVFFIGFSLTDPNFKKIFLWVNDILKKYQKKAYAFIPNADRNEVEYWRDRNIVIFNNKVSSDYIQDLNNFVLELKESINKFNIRDFKQASKYLFKNIDYKKKSFELINNLEFYLGIDKKDDAYRIANVLIENIYSFLKTVENHRIYDKFKVDILNELLLGDEAVNYSTYNLPDIIFEEFDNICSNGDIRYKLIEILCEYIELNQTTKLTVEKRIDSLKKKDLFPIPKDYDLFEIMINCSYINNRDKEQLIYNKIKELYYSERNYKNTIKFIKDNENYVKNLYYRDEIKYIELLCYKHFSDFQRILEFLKRDSFDQKNSLNDLRLGYLSYLVNDITYMKKNYENALNNDEKNISNSLTAIYNLRLMAVSDMYYGDGSYNEYLKNKEEQLDYRISFNHVNAEVFKIKEYLMKLEANIIENLAKDDKDEINYRKTIELFNTFVRTTEYYGVPDIFISQNSCFQVLFNYLRNELSINSYLDSFFSFAVYTKGRKKNDKIIDYGKYKEYIFEFLNNNAKKAISFIDATKINDEFVGFSFPVRMLDETIKYLLNVVSVFNKEEMDLIAKSMFKAIDLNLQQISNAIKQNASKLIVTIINILPPEQSAKLFEEYLQFIINKNLDWLLEIEGINFIEWDTEIFNNFNYKLLIELFHKIEFIDTYNIREYFALVLNMNSNNPIPSTFKNELLEILLKLEKYKMEYTYLLLLREMGEKDEKIKKILTNIYEKYRESIGSNSSNKRTFSTSNIQIYYIFGDLIDYIEIDKQKEILEIGVKEISRLSKSDRNTKISLFHDSYLYLKEAFQYYIVKYSIKNNNFEELNKYTKENMLNFNTSLSKSLRILFEREPTIIRNILNNFSINLKSNDKETKLNTLINLKRFYRFSTKILPEELEIIELLKYQLYDTDKKVCLWTIDVIGTIIKFNNNWAKNNFEDIINYLLVDFKIETIDSESSLMSFAYLLNNLLNLYEDNKKQIVENAINKLKNINSQRINREFKNID